MSTDSQKPTARPRRLMVLLPLLIFMGLAGLFLAQLLSGRDLTAVPSALIGQMAPETDLPPLEGMQVPGLNSADFAGKVTLVNVWASWCAPCREEHPVLLELSKDQRFSIAGLNYKDKPENARRFLGDLGSPYKAIGVDQNGRTAIDWGVYGVPETFLLGKDGKVAFKHVGPLSPEAVSTTLMPEIEKALAAQ
ncbi:MULTISPECIES: DsbE family thiol:disulfide interchange protein [Aminobacter]|jgi:cytochrome c biogenesis protein CcmG/thiol:disulfide interchange protein DsbE|uniref:Cytochrome c biogenesis protein CcmG/thiol:disulfide interchange protein DsbE n=1 Tax=Aminobacter ciceronei TaxID=150723 RepID=A0ABR6C631_9HYPH|nr:MULTISPECIES: DsbE family thiol:disulfide interchange protein [Aminobacter]WMC96815.1 DsbE family thiol:disulfide interchange protein [Aminobacter aminovorans]MBA8906334.1 cytochrome c biogenesis protein CcmG/thiol:disulfide interchange protein DsbE [Aminobacter ciceronei]MBA9020113.1 cytochrome c biogenesis protein CcmG/thiol:disulfide interchange protein DsbE [Aminobacter ciceronei]MRX36241.1 DsbE family thiol:disulfide interchange protein [Aminobacter sp. MDW-2]QNH35365.1 DsbE family thi